ncbi:MAG: cell division protein FtsQ/DivIB [Pyrinomonadaceae bacterium]
MREQVITPRAGAAGVSGSGRNTSANKGRNANGGIAQNPARRERAGKANSARRSESGSGLSAVLQYAPLIGKILLAIVVGVMLFAGYRAAASASFFQLRAVDVGGTSRASDDQIKTVVRHAVARTGVWRADLSDISRELEKLPWVRSAIVSRVLPDGLRVRVTERVPRAVVRTSAGRLVWMDDDAVSLGAFAPTDKMPDFFLTGLDENTGEAARAINRERVSKGLEMAREWDELNLSNRVSEVNLSDVRDVRAQLTGDDAEIEVRLGAKDFGKRLKTALSVLDEQRHTARGASITHLDATLERRIIIGFGSGASQTASAADATSGDGGNSSNSNENVESARAQTSEHSAQAKKQTGRKKEMKTQATAHQAIARKATEPQKKERVEKRAEKHAADNETKTKTRPRRVG